MEPAKKGHRPAALQATGRYRKRNGKESLISWKVSLSACTNAAFATTGPEAPWALMPSAPRP